jgi:hypothetical protein
VWYILFFIWWQFERCGIFCFSFYDSSNGAVYLVFQKLTIPYHSNCLKMKNKIYHTVRIVIKWKTKYNTPFELSSNEKQNIWWQFERCGIFCFSFDDSSNGVVYFVFHFITIRTVWYILFFIWRQFELPHRSNCHKMKNKIYHTVRTVMKWKTKHTTPLEPI